MDNNADIRERILMIVWLKSGKSTYEVGDLLFCPHSKVVYWKKRFESGGIDGLKTLKRSGGLDQLTSRQRKKSVRNCPAGITGRLQRYRR